METVRQIRPDKRRALFLAAFLIGGLWIFLAGFTAYAAIWWPEHKILGNNVAHWIGGVVALSCIFGAPLLIQWFADRRTVWLVNEAGITIRRGAKERSLTWSEVRSLRVLPFAAIMRTTSRPCVERLSWIARVDAEWLRVLSVKCTGRSA